jgi:hypothetical protein
MFSTAWAEMEKDNEWLIQRHFPKLSQEKLPSTMGFFGYLISGQTQIRLGNGWNFW